jgi:hypothetical protein
MVNDYESKSGANIEVKSYASYILAVQDPVNGRLDGDMEVLGHGPDR